MKKVRDPPPFGARENGGNIASHAARIPAYFANRSSVLGGSRAGRRQNPRIQYQTVRSIPEGADYFARDNALQS